MILPTLITFVLGIVALFCSRRLPPLRKDPHADQPDTFKVWLVEPERNTPGSCLIIFALFTLAYGFFVQNAFVVFGAGAVSALCLGSATVFLVKDSIQAKVEAKSLARIELTKDLIFIYGQDGQLVNEAKFADIVDLPMYQGVDANGHLYKDRILVMRSGEEIILPKYGQNGRQLKVRIQQATRMKFSYRNNSTRSKVPPL